jgi:hypothetical protein
MEEQRLSAREILGRYVALFHFAPDADAFIAEVREILSAPNDPWEEDEIQFLLNLTVPSAAEFTLWRDFLFQGRPELPVRITKNSMVMGVFNDDFDETFRTTTMYGRIKEGNIRLSDFTNLSGDIRKFMKILSDERKIEPYNLTHHLSEAENTRTLFEDYYRNISSFPLARIAPTIIEGQ